MTSEEFQYLQVILNEFKLLQVNSDISDFRFSYYYDLYLNIISPFWHSTTKNFK